METFTVYAIDDSIETASGPESVAEDADDETTAAAETDDDDSGYVPRLGPLPKRRHEIGSVRLDESGKLSLLKAEADSKEDLISAIDHMNKRETLFLKLPPDPVEDISDRFSVNKLPVKRGEPRFLEALQDNLRRFHGMELEAA